MTVEGSCLCGGVAFDVELPFRRANICHCPDGEEVSVRFGVLDGDPGIRPEYHTFVDSAAPWDVLPDDGLPRLPGAKPGE